MTLYVIGFLVGGALVGVLVGAVVAGVLRQRMRYWVTGGLAVGLAVGFVGLSDRSGPERDAQLSTTTASRARAAVRRTASTAPRRTAVAWPAD